MPAERGFYLTESVGNGYWAAKLTDVDYTRKLCSNCKLFVLLALLHDLLAGNTACGIGDLHFIGASARLSDFSVTVTSPELSFSFSKLRTGFIFIHSGCSNKMPGTGWLIHNRNLFLAVLEAWNLRSRRQQSWCLVGARLLVHRRGLFAVSSPGGRDKGALWGSLIKALIHSREFHSHALITSLRPHLQMPPFWGLGFQHVSFGGTHSISSRGPFP